MPANGTLMGVYPVTSSPTFDEVWNTGPEPKNQPCTCPVCGGKGLVQDGFYSFVRWGYGTSSGTSPEQCRSCDGKGIVWNLGY